MPAPSCGSPRWRQRRRRNGHRVDANRWAAKCPPPISKVDDPVITDVDVRAVDANVSPVIITNLALDTGVEGREAEAVELQVIFSTADGAASLVDVEEGVSDESPLKAEQSLSSVKLPIEALQSPWMDDVKPASRKGVRIDCAPPTVHEIAPYAEIYGLHPREFVFDRHYCMVPSFGFNEMGHARQAEVVNEDEIDSDEEDGDWCVEYSI